MSDEKAEEIAAQVMYRHEDLFAKLALAERDERIAKLEQELAKVLTQNFQMKALLREATEHMEYQPHDWQEKMHEVFTLPSTTSSTRTQESET